MSLRVWLPLNGNLDNQGVDSVSVTSTAILDSAGKIGQCYSFSGVNYIAIPKMVLSGTTEWTYSAWIYLNNVSTTTATCLFSCRNSVTNTGYTIFLYPNNSKMLIDDGVRYEVTPMTFAAQTWYHITVVRKTTGKFIYVNGVLKASTNTVGTASSLNANGCLIGLAQSSTALTTGDQGWRGKLNDVRIYDHALSAKEVKELSKGLVLHYPLTGGGRSGDNILSNSTGYQGITDWNGLISVATENGLPYFITKRTNTTSTSRTFITHTVITSLVSSWASGTKFTVSGYYRVPSNETYDVQANLFIRWTLTSGTSSDTNFYTPAASAVVKDIWVRFEQTFSVPANYSGGVATFYLSAFSPGLSTVHWKNVKVELGDHATPWMPNSADAEYAAMGYDSTTEYDVSGLLYNGVTTGAALTYNSDTPRYNVCSHFVSTNYIYLTSPSAEVVSISLWVKWDSIPSGQSVVFMDYKSRIGFGLMSTGILCGSVSGSYYTFSKANIQANKWYHFVIVSPNGATNTTRKLYINGVEQTATSNTSQWSYTIDQLQIGKRSTTSDGFVGCISDFRMYATALSAEDVKQLYNTAAALCNNGTLMAYSFNET